MSIENFTELKYRIEFLRESKQLNKSDFTTLLGISKAYVTELESGKKTTISNSLAKLIAYEFHVNFDWLLTGQGSMYNNAGQALPQKRLDDVSDKIMVMLDGMNEEQRRDVLKYVEKEKLLMELKQERECKKEAC
jgi:transcriptional regulator with XRE-family HTH domain